MSVRDRRCLGRVGNGEGDWRDGEKGERMNSGQGYLSHKGEGAQDCARTLEVEHIQLDPVVYSASFKIGGGESLSFCASVIVFTRLRPLVYSARVRERVGGLTSL